jgi:hypothetical protein
LLIFEKDVFCLEILKGKRLLGRPRCIWEDNIKMDLRDLREVGFGAVGWILWLETGTSRWLL